MSSTGGSFGWLAMASASSSSSNGGGSSSRTAGALAAAAWLRTIGATPPVAQRWHVEIALEPAAHRPPSDFDEGTATRFQIGIYSEEWGFFFCHRGRASWIRVTDLAFVHGRDDFGLLTVAPPLKDVDQLLRRLEQQHALQFQRQHASIKTSVAGSEPAIAAWINSL